MKYMNVSTKPDLEVFVSRSSSKYLPLCEVWPTAIKSEYSDGLEGCSGSSHIANDLVDGVYWGSIDGIDIYSSLQNSCQFVKDIKNLTLFSISGDTLSSIGIDSDVPWPERDLLSCQKLYNLIIRHLACLFGKECIDFAAAEDEFLPHALEFVKQGIWLPSIIVPAKYSQRKLFEYSLVLLTDLKQLIQPECG